MRLRACCTARSSKPVKLQVTLAKPPVRGKVTENGRSSRPNPSSSARAPAAPKHAALPAYDGYGGVVSSGVHVESKSVEDTLRLAKHAVEARELDLLIVAGKTEPVRVFELRGPLDPAGCEGQRPLS